MSAPTEKEIRQAYSDYRQEWDEIYEQGDLDMQAISPEGPWTPEDRNAREGAGRPCVHLDQINQFINQVIGNVRKSKRAVQLTPKGSGADDKDAERRSAMIMGIEERSQAQPIYLYTFENMVQRSFGFAKIVTEFANDEDFDQELLIKAILNPRTVIFSPHYKNPDASDVPEVFEIERMLKTDYKRKYKDAKIVDFSGEVMAGEHVSDWITEKYVQVGADWRVEYDRTKILLVETELGSKIFTEEAWKEARHITPGTVKRERTVEKPKVTQYLTNGLEILDTVPWAGSRIPIIACFGPERWVLKGGEAKRQLLSMTRFARDPQMLFDFLATQECEIAGMVPKSPFVGYKGQFESDKETWEEITKIPHAFVQADVVVDGASGQVLPKPERADLSAPFQEYELAKDSAYRAVQSAMGNIPLPTAAQRRSEKSGVALERIDNVEALGTFAFIDRFENCFLNNMGWQLNELLGPIYDTPREMPMGLPDGKHAMLQVIGKTSHPIENGAYDVQGLPEDHLHTAKGDFGVTISTGPSHDSEREAQDDFVDELIENMQNLPQPGTPAAKVLALGIRMRPTLGPIGKQIADVFDPPDPNNLSPEAQTIVQQLQAQIQQLTEENQALHMDRAGRVLEQQTKKEIEGIKATVAENNKKWDYIIQVVKAQLAAKSRSSDLEAQRDADMALAELGFHHDQIDRAHDAAHELAMRESAPPEPAPEPQPAQ